MGLGVLPLRRRFPLAVFGVTLAMAAVHYADPVIGLSPAELAVPIALYSLAAAKPRRVSLSALGGGITLGLIASAVIGKSLGAGWLMQPSDISASGLALAAAWFAGDGSRTRRAYLAEVERRARDAERDRDRRAELAVAAERVAHHRRIARRHRAFPQRHGDPGPGRRFRAPPQPSRRRPVMRSTRS